MMLDRIVLSKRKKLAALDRRKWEAWLESLLPGAAPPVSFRRALRRNGGPAVIAEFKRKSPSAGAVTSVVACGEQVRLYERAGAAALSVLTDEEFFSGTLEDLAAAKKAAALPVLRKDFIIDPLQVVEARAFGADAVLLIVGILEKRRLQALLKEAWTLHMDCLCEVHSKEEIRTALAAGADIVGINNRDLNTLQIDLNTTLRLRPSIPRGIPVVSESGICCAEDVHFVGACGVDAVLVGTALMRTPRVAEKLSELRG